MQNLFKIKNQEEFLIQAFDFHRKKSYSYDLFLGTNWKIIDWLYKLGKDYKILQIDYNQFVRIMNDNQKDYHSGYYRPRRSYAYSGSRWGHFCDIKYFRISRRFIYSGQSKKDKPSKNAWREHKKMGKDKSRSRFWKRSWKKNLKHFCKRKHRRLEKEALKNECYDRLHSWSYKHSDNPWNWD
jgi:hypothetical protein